MLEPDESRRASKRVQKIDDPVLRLDVAKALSKVKKIREAPQWVHDALAGKTPSTG